MRIKDNVLENLKGMGYEVGISDSILITFRGHAVKYHVGRSFLSNISGGSNSIMLNLIYGETYDDHVEIIYGYRTLGSWPPYRSITDLQRLLADMESRGAIIKIV